MRRKMARSAPPPPFGPPGVAAVIRTASLACQNAVKAQKFVQLQESSEESRITTCRRDAGRLQSPDIRAQLAVLGPSRSC